MKYFSIATMAAALMAGGVQAHTVNSDAEATSAILMLVAFSEQPELETRVRRGDLSRSPEQIRRARLATRHDPRTASFSVAVQKPPM